MVRTNPQADDLTSVDAPPRNGAGEARPRTPPPPPSRRGGTASLQAATSQLPPGSAAQPGWDGGHGAAFNADAAPQAALPAPNPEQVEEVNPFQKPRRIRQWLQRSKRELAVHAAIALVAGCFGWLAGAKPWAPRTHRVASAAKAAVTKPTARSAAKRPAQPNRRVAVTKHAARTMAKASGSSAKPTRSGSAAHGSSHTSATSKTRAKH